MQQSLNRFRQLLPRYHHYLLIAFVFSLPISVAINNILKGFIVLLWIAGGNFYAHWERIKSNPVAVWAMLFVVVHLIGLLWTSDLPWGFHMVGKVSSFLLLPILLTIIQTDKIRTYIITFILAMTFSEMISYAIFFDFLPHISDVNEKYPTPFIDHLSYAPFLAFSIYILIHQQLFSPEPQNRWGFLSLFLIFTMSYNLFISGGRAGQVAFFVIYGIVILQFFHKNLLKAVLILFISIPLIFALLYQTTPSFAKRANQAFHDINHYRSNANTSVGARITYTLNSIDIIKHHPLLGVGTGDFKEEYQKINASRSPLVPVPDQPHNMYLLVLTQLGIFGFVPFIMMIATQIRISTFKYSALYRIQLTLPVLFIVIMLSDSYLLGHFTTMLFIFFSAILFKDATWKS